VRRSPLAVVLLVVMGALGAVEVGADFRNGYREGVRAVERRQWQRAVENLEEAIGHNPASGETVLLYGRRFVRYLPYWYLGLAKYHLGDQRGAAEAWQRELDQGAIQGEAALFAELQRLWPEVGGALVGEPTPSPPDPALAQQLADAVREAEGALERATQAAGALAGVTGRPGFDEVLASQPGLRQDRERADELVRQARARLQQGRAEGDLAALQSAASLAEEAYGGYGALLPRARQGLEAVELARQQERERQRGAEAERLAEEGRREEARAQQAVADLRVEMTRLRAEGRQLLERASRLEEAPAPLQRDGQRLESLLERAVTTADEPQALRALRDELRQALLPYQAALAEALAAGEEAAAERARQAEARGGPPADLMNAARAYFSADYERAIELLGGVETFESRARAQAHLFRAAAAFTLYHLSQGPETELLERVRREIEALLALEPELRPDPDLFSPRFVRFFHEMAG
jgi:hypothetical protein